MAIYKDKKNGTYYVKFRQRNGKSTTKRGFKTKLQAQQYEIKLSMKQEDTTNIPVFDVINEQLNYIRRNRSYGTYKRAYSMYEKIIKPNIANKPINKISELDCLKFRNELDEMAFATNYKTDILIRFKSLFKFAQKYYGLLKDPSTNLEQFKKSRDEKIKDREKESNIWSIDEFNRFISEVANERYKLFFATLFFTGMRKGELQALTWKDIKDHKIDINKSLTKKTDKGHYEIKDPKNDSSVRIISVNETLYNLIMEYKESEMKCPGFNEEWFVFGRDKPLPQTTIDREKDKAIVESGVKRIRIHDFRHSHASILVSNGMNIVAISKRLGHSSIEMTLKKYTHLINKNEDELIENIEQCSQKVLKEIKKPYK